MASKNIVLKGATWNGVESVDFPVSGGGTALYVETSDADATAADIASGKKAYVNGSLIVGSATAPVLTTKSITQNGTYNASSDSADGYSSVTVNVSGGGGSGLEYETGTWTPSENIARGEVLFANAHSDMPAYIALGEYASSATSVVGNTNQTFVYVDLYKLFGGGVHYGNTGNAYRYSLVQYGRCANNSLNIYSTATSYNSDNQGDSDNTYPRYWVQEDRFFPYSNSATFYWRAGITYKWMAVWAPTS